MVFVGIWENVEKRTRKVALSCSVENLAALAGLLVKIPYIHKENGEHSKLKDRLFYKTALSLFLVLGTVFYSVAAAFAAGTPLNVGTPIPSPVASPAEFSAEAAVQVPSRTSEFIEHYRNFKIRQAQTHPEMIQSGKIPSKQPVTTITMSAPQIEKTLAPITEESQKDSLGGSASGGGGGTGGANLCPLSIGNSEMSFAALQLGAVAYTVATDVSDNGYVVGFYDDSQNGGSPQTVLKSFRYNSLTGQIDILALNNSLNPTLGQAPVPSPSPGGFAPFGGGMASRISRYGTHIIGVGCESLGSSCNWTDLNSFKPRAIRWSSPSRIDYVPQPSPAPTVNEYKSEAFDVSADGRRIVGYRILNSNPNATIFLKTPDAFLWKVTSPVPDVISPDQAGVAQALPTPSAVSADDLAMAVSDGGDVVAGIAKVTGSGSGTQFQPYIKSDLDLPTLPPLLPDLNSTQYHIPDTTCSVAQQDKKYSNIFGGSPDLSVLVGTSMCADTMTSPIREAARWEKDAQGAWVVTGAGFLDTIPGYDIQKYFSELYESNIDGSLSVGRGRRAYDDPTYGQQTQDFALVWRKPDQGVRDLKEVLNTQFQLDIGSGWILESANGVSSDGRYIVGNARCQDPNNPLNNKVLAFVLHANVSQLPALSDGDYSSAGSINQAGQVFGTAKDAPNQFYPTYWAPHEDLWSDGAVLSLPVNLQASYPGSSVMRANNFGHMVGTRSNLGNYTGYITNSPDVAFPGPNMLYDSSYPVPPGSPPLSSTSYANAFNDIGIVGLDAMLGGQMRSILTRSNGSIAALFNVLPFSSGYASKMSDINLFGQTILNRTTSGYPSWVKGYLYNDNNHDGQNTGAQEYLMLPTLANDSATQLNSISDLGVVVGLSKSYMVIASEKPALWYDKNQNGLYEANEVVQLRGAWPSCSGTSSIPGCSEPVERAWANSINGLGQIVGNVMTSSGVNKRAVLWEGYSRYDLNSLLPLSTGWDLREAYGINSRGEIVGLGVWTDQNLIPHTRGFKLKLPEVYEDFYADLNNDGQTQEKIRYKRPQLTVAGDFDGDGFLDFDGDGKWDDGDLAAYNACAQNNALCVSPLQKMRVDINHNGIAGDCQDRAIVEYRLFYNGSPARLWIPGDLDGNRQVNQADAQLFESCSMYLYGSLPNPSCGYSAAPVVNCWAADMNRDGWLTAEDYNLFAKIYGLIPETSGSMPIFRGDMDNDGDVDFEDQDLYANCFGASGPQSAAWECYIADINKNGKVTVADSRGRGPYFLPGDLDGDCTVSLADQNPDLINERFNSPFSFRLTYHDVNPSNADINNDGLVTKADRDAMSAYINNHMYISRCELFTEP